MCPPHEVHATSEESEAPMDWKDTPEQATFRGEVTTLIEDRLPQRYRTGADNDDENRWEVDRVAESTEARQAAQDWESALVERGWLAPHWPKEYGGAGLSPMEQFIFNQEMARVDAPRVGGQGVSQLGPTLIVHGTDEQRQEHLPRILSGEVCWRQGYSEPGSGSDLASLQTRAIRDGDEYVINGQKIWTSAAHIADWLYVLVRTDPDAPKHRGISFLLMDKQTPGISIRPLVDMGWRHSFNEVFFEDVHVPVGHLVGEENRGWYVGMTLLDYERSNITGAVSARRTIDHLLDFVATDDGREVTRLEERPPMRQAIADRYIESEVMFNFSARIISMQSHDLIPNYEASVSKLFGSELNQRLALTGTRLFGLYGAIWDRTDPRAPLRAELTHDYIFSIPSTIGAGTSEIQRNIIATRGLGLPRG
jgi:alkylation response protein AidB-like acyl-CoA dehydrogenase